MKKTRKPKVILLGPQAAGKGTQAHILSTWSGAPRMSMGDLFREIQNEDSDRGRTVKELLAKGDLVPDEITLGVIKDWIVDHPDGWVIDGFPRSLEQAAAAESFLDPDGVVFLQLSDEEAKKRLSYRRVCVKCKTNYNTVTQPPKNDAGVCDFCGGELMQRDDDRPEVVEERLKIYHEKTAPLQDWYAKKGLTLTVDAKPGIPKVAHEIQRLVEAAMAKRSRKGGKKWWILLIVGVILVALGILAYIGSA